MMGCTIQTHLKTGGGITFFFCSDASCGMNFPQCPTFRFAHFGKGNFYFHCKAFFGTFYSGNNTQIFFRMIAGAAGIINSTGNTYSHLIIFLCSGRRHDEKFHAVVMEHISVFCFAVSFQFSGIFCIGDHTEIQIIIIGKNGKNGFVVFINILSPFASESIFEFTCMPCSVPFCIRGIAVDFDIAHSCGSGTGFAQLGAHFIIGFDPVTIQPVTIVFKSSFQDFIISGETVSFIKKGKQFLLCTGDGKKLGTSLVACGIPQAVRGIVPKFPAVVMIFFHGRIGFAVILAFHIFQNLCGIKIRIPQHFSGDTVPLPVGIGSVGTEIFYSFFRRRPELGIGKKHLFLPAFPAHFAEETQVFCLDLFQTAIHNRSTVGIFIQSHTGGDLSPRFHQIEMSNVSLAGGVIEFMSIAAAMGTIVDDGAFIILHIFGNGAVGMICPGFQKSSRIFLIKLCHDLCNNFMETGGNIDIIKFFRFIQFAAFGTFAPAGSNVDHTEKIIELICRNFLIDTFHIIINAFLYFRIGDTDLLPLHPFTVLQCKIFRMFFKKTLGNRFGKGKVTAIPNGKDGGSFHIEFFFESAFVVPGGIDLEALTDGNGLTVHRSSAGSTHMGKLSVTEDRITDDLKIRKFQSSFCRDIFIGIFFCCGSEPADTHFFIKKSISTVKFPHTVFPYDVKSIAFTDDGKSIRRFGGSKFLCGGRGKIFHIFKSTNDNFGRSVAFSLHRFQSISAYLSGIMGKFLCGKNGGFRDFIPDDDLRILCYFKSTEGTCGKPGKKQGFQQCLFHIFPFVKNEYYLQ